MLLVRTNETDSLQLFSRTVDCIVYGLEVFGGDLEAMAEPGTVSFSVSMFSIRILSANV